MYNKDRFKIYIQVQIKIYLYCLLAGSVSIHFFIYNWILICRNQNYYQKSQFEVWEICKFWILQNISSLFWKSFPVWEICKFWILQNNDGKITHYRMVWEICKFWILQNTSLNALPPILFERYVNFEFYKTIYGADNVSGEFERYVNFEFYKT